MTKMRNLAALVCSGVLSLLACSSHGPGDSVGGYSNWLPCTTLSECPVDHEPRAAACTSGYCVDAAGERLVRAPSAQTAGDGSGGAMAGQGAGATAGQSAGDGAGASAGQSAGQGGAGIDGGNITDAALEDAGASGPMCGSTRCPLGQACCDHCLGLCVNALSGAHCPDDITADRPCDDAGVDAGTAFRFPQCPGVMERCAGTCLDGMPCQACGQGEICVELDLSCGPAGGSTAQCIADPCAGAPLSCECAGSVCATADPTGVLAFCSATAAGQPPLESGDAPILSCAGGGICASPDTPIATPHGDVAIAALREGDLVYSLHRGQLVAVPLLAVARTPVTHHRVVQLQLQDGSVLEISAPHPLADGRTLGSLRAGDTLDGLAIVRSELIDYAHPYTHDILPASDSAAYLVHGVWLGSTLALDLQ